MKRHRAGRVPAAEVLISTAYIRDCIENKEKTKLIKDAISQGTSQYGMQTFDQALVKLVKEGLVTLERARLVTAIGADSSLPATSSPPRCSSTACRRAAITCPRSASVRNGSRATLMHSVSSIACASAVPHTRPARRAIRRSPTRGSPS